MGIISKLVRKGTKKLTKKKTTAKKKPTREEIKKANRTIAKYKPKIKFVDKEKSFEKIVFDKKVVKKAQENIARIAKKRGISQREFRKNNLNNPSVRLVYNNNPNMAFQDGGTKLFNELASDPKYINFY